MFGVYIDPQSEKFQEAVAKKELEERKAEKALKKQMKQQKMLEQLKSIADAERAKQQGELNVFLAIYCCKIISKILGFTQNFKSFQFQHLIMTRQVYRILW